MPNSDDARTYADRLRRRGEELVARGDNRTEVAEVLTLDGARAVLHELLVHQAELEIQNEELSRAQLQMDNLRAHYFELFDLAPVGYCNLDGSGLIQEANLTTASMLAVASSTLAGKPISRFIVPEDQGLYFQHRKQLVDTSKPQALDLRLVRGDGSPIWTHLAISGEADTEGVYKFRLVLSDISKQKQDEETLRASLHRYQSLFANMLNGFAHCQVLFEKGRPVDYIFLAVNAAFEAKTGLKHVVGRKVSTVLPGIHETDPQLLETYGRVAMTGVSEHIELFVEALREWVSITVYCPGQGQFVAMFDVISERKAAEDALRVSEGRVRAKLHAILDPEGDLEALDLADILDVPLIKEMMEHIFTLTGITSALLDIQGQVLIGVGFQDICSNYHRVHNEACRNCTESDTVLSSQIEPGTFRMYKCRNHLWDLALPIHVSGRHVGNLFLGQFFLDDEVPDRELFKAQAQHYGFAESGYLAALDRVPRVKQEKVTAIAKFYIQFAALISDLSYGSIKLARALHTQHRVEAALRESEAQNRALISSIPDLIFMNRVDGEFLAVHASSPGLLFLPPAAFLHRTVAEVLPKPLAEQFMQAYAEAVATRAVQELVYSLPIDGEEHYFEARVAPASEDTVITIVRNVTERKQSEDQHLALQAQLQQAQKMESLGSLAGGVAHDMNNVLGAILGIASAHLESQPEGSDTKHALDTICRAAVRGGTLVRSLLSFARQSPVEVRELDMNLIIQEGMQLLERTTLATVRLELNLASDLRPLHGDPSALTHALMNLCVNAVDAMPTNGTLTLTTNNVGQDWIEVLVQDNGTGMSKEVMERAADPFFTTKEVGKGTGLGLALVYSTVKAHGGQLDIQSEPGQGTCIRMRLPTCTPGIQVAGTPGEPRLQTASGALSILLVDDDVLILNAIEAVLKVLGHTVVSAPSGERALAQVEAGLVPEVVILDINMPGLGGVGTLPHLRALLPTVPVLLSTGRVDQTALDAARTHAGVSLLSKPFSLEALKEALSVFQRK